MFTWLYLLNELINLFSELANFLFKGFEVLIYKVFEWLLIL